MPPAKQKSPGKRPAALIPLACTLALLLLLGAGGVLTALNRAWFDTIQRIFASRAPIPENTAIVLVDEQSLRALGADPYAMRWPWPRRAFAGLFTALDRAGAKHVLADFIFFENSNDAVDDALLGSVSAGLRTVTLGALRGRDGNSNTAPGNNASTTHPASSAPATPSLPVVWPENFRQLHARLFVGETERWGWVDCATDTDGVIRRYTPAGSLAAAAALPKNIPAAERLLRWRGGLEQLKARGVPVLPAAPFVAAGLRLLSDAAAQAENFDNPAALARAIEMQPAPAGEIFGRVRGRTVFVGVNAAGTFDAVATPAGAPEPGVIVHWTALADLRVGTFARDAGPAAQSAAAFAAALCVTLAAARRHSGPGRLAIAAASVVLAALALSVVLLLQGGLWLAPAGAVIAASLAFAAEALAGYLRERSHKREIQNWFGAYVSPAVVENLIRNPASINLAGERRDLTVFFSDIAGFTTLSEKLPSSQLVALVNTYLHELSESVLSHGCYLDKYIGDAIMAVFGAPEPLENHALAACRAALDSQRRLAELNTHMERAFGTRLAIRIGINTGEMIVGNVGSEKKKNYTVLGDAVNLAARLEGANKEFGTSILIGPQTARRVAGQLATRPVAMLRVKGKTEAVTVHELVGELASITDAQHAHMDACADGFDAWCARRFEQAAFAFAHAVMLRPGDIASANYHDAALRYLKHPPAENWLPVLELHSK